MIHIDLPFPVILRGDFRKVNASLPDGMEQVLRFCAYVFVKDGSVRVIDEKGFLDLSGGDKELCSIGPSGVIRAAGALGLAVPSRESIDLPSDLYWETGREWFDLSNLCARLEMKADRYRCLLDIGAPDIIMRNEGRMLCEAVWALEDNRSGKVAWGDGSPVISLIQVGWDLSNGSWTAEKKAEIDRANAAIDQEWEVEADEE